MNNGERGGLECRWCSLYSLSKIILLFILKLMFYLIQFYSDVNQIYVGEARHCDTYEGIFVLTLLPITLSNHSVIMV